MTLESSVITNWAEARRMIGIHLRMGAGGGDRMGYYASGMSDERGAEELAAQAAEAVRRLFTEAESRAQEIVRQAEADAASIREQAEADAAKARERAEADARAQI